MEADRHYLRCLITPIDFKDQQAAKNSLQAKLLSNEITNLLDKPLLVSHICYAFDNSGNQSLKEIGYSVEQCSKALSFSLIEELALTLALRCSSVHELADNAKQHLKVCLSNLLTSYIILGKFIYCCSPFALTNIPFHTWLQIPQQIPKSLT